MRITGSGKITDNFYVVGDPGVPVYLMDGESPALFDSGFTALAQVYEQHIKEIMGNHAPVYLFLTHAHFDHVGSASYFKKLWPEMKIAGSPRAQETLARPRVLQLIRRLNREAAGALLSWGREALYEAPFQACNLDMILAPGQEVQLGASRTVKAIPTPGHTWDFMSYWLPDEKILIASEAVGCDDGSGYIMTEFLVDYDTYIGSLQELSKLDIQILCPGHRCVFTGPDAKSYMRRSLEQAAIYVHMVERLLNEEGGDIERTVARVKVVEWEPKPTPKQPEPAYVLNTRARVTHIRERMKKPVKSGPAPVEVSR